MHGQNTSIFFLRMFANRYVLQSVSISAVGSAVYGLLVIRLYPAHKYDKPMKSISMPQFLVTFSLLVNITY